MTRVGSSAALAVVTLTVLLVGGVRARFAGPELRTVSVLTTARHPSPPTSTAPVTRPATPSSTSRPAPTTTVGPAVKARAADPKTRPTTTTTRPAQPAIPRRPPRATCLALATMNHYAVVAANSAWLQAQLRVLAADRLLGSPQYKALQIEEAHALIEIDAQYSIDKSNCYLPARPLVPGLPSK